MRTRQSKRMKRVEHADEEKKEEQEIDGELDENEAKIDMIIDEIRRNTENVNDIILEHTNAVKQYGLTFVVVLPKMKYNLRMKNISITNRPYSYGILVNNKKIGQVSLALIVSISYTIYNDTMQFV